MLSLFRLHFVIYWVAGIGALIASGVAYQMVVTQNADFAAALAAPAPEATPLGAFDAVSDTNGADEVVIVATLGVDAEYELTETRNGAVRRRSYAAPLRIEGAQGGPITAVLVEPESVPDDAWFFAAQTGFDGAAPVLTVHGRIIRPESGLRDQIADAFGERGLTLSDDVIYIDPFLQDRETELAAQDPVAGPSLIAAGGGALFLYGFWRRSVRRRARAQQAAA